MGRFVDLTGQTFSKLNVKYKIENESKHTYWLCECECGNKKEARSDALRDGTTRHCGCVGLGKHNLSNHRLFNIWSGMKERCYNINSRDYMRYGGRGIRITNEWRDDFLTFYNWAIKNGYENHLSIDRKDVNGNYEPSNCKWATPEEQANNTRKNNLIGINGEIKSVSQWSRLSGVSRYIIKKRFMEGVRGKDLLLPHEDAKAEFSSGVPYIKWDKRKKSWRTEVKVSGVLHYIGYIKDLNEAIQRQEEFKQKLIKQFEREEVDVE